jgi:methionyl aminopeptidase
MGSTIPVKSPDDIGRMRRSGRIAVDALAAVEEVIRPGVSTAELDAAARSVIEQAGARPAFLGYHGYPATICASVNEEVVHGIPSVERRLFEGDIVSVDVGVVLDGFFGDSARTFAIGVVSEESRTLMDVTLESLFRGLSVLRGGIRLGVLSSTIQRYVERRGFSVVRQFVGHGIGRRLHEEPQVPNFGRPGDGPLLRPGMTLAVEPMVNAGTHKVRTLDDGWTVVTEDGKPSAHFEQTVVVLSDGVDVLTDWKHGL